MANRLINELSPYLLQHAHNPVDWYPWGDEAFQKAKAENKPVLVSIGYAACHWCHVMERESFENVGTAAYMNEHFINIKVDREEHPDVDHLYMDAVQAISGSGGWPLNVFITPEKIPFYGGTYFPPVPMYNRSSWLQVLTRMNEIWVNQPDEISAQSKQMEAYLLQASKPMTKGVDTWDLETCRQIADNILKQGDKVNGGFGQAPKFPGTLAISFLFEHNHFTGNKEAQVHALKSLDAMINGGIYDQLGGGLARYAIDDKWLVPHFEKMLYDNALLILALCDAYSSTKNPVYGKKIEEIIAFAERELKDPSGGYYSAIDADSEGVEGKFYVWDWNEWRKVCGDDEFLNEYFGVSQEGNWEGTNILNVAKDIYVLANEHNISSEDAQTRINKAKTKLLAVRSRRIRPLTDDKSLLSWNALLNLALSKSAHVLQDKKYVNLATDHMYWMLENFNVNGQMMHVWKQGQARIIANLDDYAYLIQALLQLATTSANTKWIIEANKLNEIVQNEFIHEDSTFFYFSSVKQDHIPIRKVDLYDGATPSANAVMAYNSMILGFCMERYELIDQSVKMLGTMINSITRYSTSFALWAIIAQKHVVGNKIVICTGPKAEEMFQQIRLSYIPQAYSLTSEKEISDIPVLRMKFSATESCIFVCTEQACLPISTDLETALPFISLLK